MLNNNHQHQPDTPQKIPLAIRRHASGSSNPNFQSPMRRHSPPSNTRLTVQRNPFQPNSSSASIRKYSATSLDSDERPIKPMKDTSVYNLRSTQKKNIQPRKPSPLPISKSRQSSPPYDSDSYQSPPRSQMSYISQRRPIRTDLIPKTPFGIPPQRSRPRQIIVEEYDDYDYPVTYVKPIPKKIISYKKVSGMTTRELENYNMSKPRRVVRVRSPPVETIIYQN